MDNCIFCKIINKQLPSHILYEDKNIISFLDINPINNGHALIVPKRHCANFSDLHDSEASDLAIVSKKILNAILNSEILSQGANLLMNQGTSAGQDIFHFHWHLIPRHEQDFLGLAFNRSSEKFKPTELPEVVNKIKSYIK